MAELNETPRGNRVHIAFFGLRNAGKSTLVNAFAGQPIAIVSDTPGTTTDPVSKAMEILPLGPCLITDTAGLEGELGELRVGKSLEVLATVDIAVWVCGAEGTPAPERIREGCKSRGAVLLEYHRGESVEDLKRKIAAVKLEEKTPGLLDGLVKSGDRVLCVVPIDESAPKGRLILPQQQVIRECLDKHVICTVCQVDGLEGLGSLGGLEGFDLVITDSQVFGEVDRMLQYLNHSKPPKPPKLTSFSILFARQKGDLREFVKGLAAIKTLKDGDKVLVAEGCTHHRQCNDIGAVKIPKALERLSGKTLKFEFVSGAAPLDSLIRSSGHSAISLVVHCGGCMLTRREMLRRIALAKEAGVPIVNYGLVLAMANGLRAEDVLI